MEGIYLHVNKKNVSHKNTNSNRNVGHTPGVALTEITAVNY